MFEKVDYVVLGILLSIMLAASVFIFVKAQTESACYRAGFHDGAVDYKLNQYCIRLYEATSYTVPLEEVKKHTND